jgi:hypothetical protein
MRKLLLLHILFGDAITAAPRQTTDACLAKIDCRMGKAEGSPLGEAPTTATTIDTASPGHGHAQQGHVAAGVGAGTGEHEGREGKRKIEPISLLGGGIGL